MRQRLLLVIGLTAVSISLVIGCGKKERESPQSGADKQPLVTVRAAEAQDVSDVLELTGEVVATNVVVIRATVEGPISFCPWREGDRVKAAGQTLIEIARPVYEAEVESAAAELAVAGAKLRDLEAGARPEEIAQAKESVKELEQCTAFSKSDVERITKLVESGAFAGELLEKARVAYVKCQTQLAAAREKLAMLEAGPTKTAIDVQQAVVDLAKANLALAKARFAECTIRAAFPGAVTAVYVRPGDLATPQAPLLEIMDESSLVVRFAVPEKDVAQLRNGQDVILNFDAYPGKSLNAKITRVYPQLDAGTRTRTAEAKVKSRDEVELSPGMFARAHVILNVIRGAIIIPASGILTTPTGAETVFVVEDGKAHARSVKTGREYQGKVHVLEGIARGDKVIIAGHERLKDGAAVKVPGSSRPSEASPQREKSAGQ
jgi:multidrug efflux pump subunit AcrA (membrane-fusion protein)